MLRCSAATRTSGRLFQVVKGADRKLIFGVLHILRVMQDLLFRAANQIAADQMEHLILYAAA